MPDTLNQSMVPPFSFSRIGPPRHPIAVIGAGFGGLAAAIRLQAAGCQVTYVCTDNMACSFGVFTTEQPSVQRSMMKAGIEMVFSQNLEGWNGAHAELSCMYTEKETVLEADAMVLVTAKLPNDALFYDLQRLLDEGKGGLTKSISRIGDCEAPAPIASAVYAGRRYGMELDDNSGINYSLRRDANFSDLAPEETS